MAKAALTILDGLLVLILVAIGLREILTFQIGTSSYLPKAGQVAGFDIAKVLIFSLCVMGVRFFVKRMKIRSKTA